jgi:hypothetical protein
VRRVLGAGICIVRATRPRAAIAAYGTVAVWIVRSVGVGGGGHAAQRLLGLRNDELREAAGRTAFRQGVLVAAYKGEHLRTVPREIEKDQVGQVWAARSGGRARFAMLFKQQQGMNVAQQLDAVLR